MALIKCPECGKEISDKAPACPNCGNPMDTPVKQEASEPVREQIRPEAPIDTETEKQPKKKSGLLKILLIAAGVFLILAVIIGVAGGGSTDKKSTPANTAASKQPVKEPTPESLSGNVENDAEEEEIPEEKIYIDDSQIAQFFSAPKDLKGKYVRLSGRIFTTPETNGTTTALQIMYDPENSSQSFIAYIENATENYNQNDYVIVDGMINGSIRGTNLMGGVLEPPVILADTVELSSYLDVVSPTRQEISYGASVDQNGAVVTLDKIQFADNETRVYISVTNNSDSTFNIYQHTAKVIQNSSQYEAGYAPYNADYPDISSNILPGVTSAGVFVFPAFDASADFQLYIEGRSDNYEIDFEPYIFNCSLAE